MKYPKDEQFERHTVRDVTRGRGGYGVTFEDGWGLYFPDAGIEPEPGDAVRLYGPGFGHEVRGIAIEGKGVIRYETEREQRRRWEREQVERDAEKQAQLDSERAERDLTIQELPAPLRERIHGFQQAREHWRRDFEPYEVFVCQEAAKVAAHFEGENAVYRLNEWAGLPYAEQAKAGPEMSDQHSGNTFGQAVSLARYLLLGDDSTVINAHGALCPLVGCEEYGCSTVRKPVESGAKGGQGGER